MDEKERALLSLVNTLVRRADRAVREAQATENGLLPLSIVNLADAAEDVRSWIERNYKGE